MMYRSFFSRALVAGLLAFGVSAQAVQYQGQEFPDTLQLGGKPLVLSGIGERAAYGFHGYTAALYMTRKATTPEEVYAVTGPKRLEMRITLPMKSIGANEFIKAINKSMDRNCTEEERAAVGERIQRLNANIALVGSVKKGDLILIDFVPERGTTFVVNGKALGDAVPGADVYSAFLKAFIGNRVSDDRLKAGLLGQPTYKGQPT